MTDLAELCQQLERHSQVDEAKILVPAYRPVGIRIYWKSHGAKDFTPSEAREWLDEHPPRCWSWTHSPARNTVRDYCTLNLDHEGPHHGDREEWG